MASTTVLVRRLRGLPGAVVVGSSLVGCAAAIVVVALYQGCGELRGLSTESCGELWVAAVLTEQQSSAQVCALGSGLSALFATVVSVS